MYRHLQRLSPRFYARTRLGDIVSRINNDIGEIQRVAAEAALAWVGNVLFLVGTSCMLAWLDWRLFLLTRGDRAARPRGRWCCYRRRLEARVAVLRQRSADIGSFLIETLQAHAAGGDRRTRRQREAERFRATNDASSRALMSMQRLTYLSGGLPGLILSAGTRRRVRLRRLARDRRHADARHVRRVHRLPDARAGAGAGADGPVREPGDGASVAAPRVRRCSTRRSTCRSAPTPSRCRRSRGEVAFEQRDARRRSRRAGARRLSFTRRAGRSRWPSSAPSGSGKSTIADLLRAAARSRQRRRPARRPRPADAAA